MGFCPSVKSFFELAYLLFREPRNHVDRTVAIFSAAHNFTLLMQPGQRRPVHSVESDATQGFLARQDIIQRRQKSVHTVARQSRSRQWAMIRLRVTGARFSPCPIAVLSAH